MRRPGFGVEDNVDGLATLLGLLVGGSLGDAIGLVLVLSAGAGMWLRHARRLPIRAVADGFRLSGMGAGRRELR